MRVPITREFREKAKLECGDIVDAALELDLTRRPVLIPIELRAVFKKSREVATLYDKLAPSMRRAWATYVAEAKQPETRQRRASRAATGIRARAFPR